MSIAAATSFSTASGTFPGWATTRFDVGLNPVFGFTRSLRGPSLYPTGRVMLTRTSFSLQLASDGSGLLGALFSPAGIGLPGGSTSSLGYSGTAVLDVNDYVRSLFAAIYRGVLSQASCPVPGGCGP
jgi:hypothetical protein